MFLFLCWNRELNVKKQGKSNIPLLESTYYINQVIIKIQYFWDNFGIGMFGSSKKICSCFFSLFDVCSLIRNITIHQGTKKNVIPFSSFLIFFFFQRVWMVFHFIRFTFIICVTGKPFFQTKIYKYCIAPQFF